METLIKQYVVINYLYPPNCISMVLILSQKETSRIYHPPVVLLGYTYLAPVSFGMSSMFKTERS